MPLTAISEVPRPGPLDLSHGRNLDWHSGPLIMGVLNLTPDSFSDGGLWMEPTAAIEHAQRMVDLGADIIDLGAESTRPGGGVYGRGAQDVSPEEELRRLLPVLEALRARLSIPISVDTRKGVVARAALAAGADLINDISGLTDPGLAEAVAESGSPIILMHSRGSLDSMQRDIDFDDVVSEVTAELRELAARAVAAGIGKPRILLDPGIGFGKTAAQNLSLLRHLDTLGALGYPILVGASRKSFIDQVADAPVEERLPGSLAAVAWAARQGAAVVRVHDVAETRQFLTIWQAIQAAKGVDK